MSGRCRRGVALLLVLAALLVLDLLVAGLAALARDELLTGRALLARERAAAAADGEVLRQLAAWDDTVLAVLPVGGRQPFTARTWGVGVLAAAEVERLGGSVYRVTGRGRVLDAAGRLRAAATVTQLIQRDSAAPGAGVPVPLVRYAWHAPE